MAVGDTHPTTITFDLALYEKVVQLLDSRPDLKSNVVPRLGELHVVMAALRAIGVSMDMFKGEIKMMPRERSCR